MYHEDKSSIHVHDKIHISHTHCVTSGVTLPLARTNKSCKSSKCLVLMDGCMLSLNRWINKVIHKLNLNDQDIF